MSNLSMFISGDIVWKLDIVEYNYQRSERCRSPLNFCPHIQHMPEPFSRYICPRIKLWVTFPMDLLSTKKQINSTCASELRIVAPLYFVSRYYLYHSTRMCVHSKLSTLWYYELYPLNHCCRDSCVLLVYAIILTGVVATFRTKNKHSSDPYRAGNQC